MKTILVPVDFSKACDNALDYAVEFARRAKLDLLLLNVYDYALVPSDPLIWVPSIDEFVDERIQRLEAIREKIQLQYGKQLNVKCYSEAGTVIDTVNSFVEKHHVDLIIMGMQGGGFLSEKIIGSTTTSLMRKSACPVLGIGTRVKFHALDQIVFATDYQDADYKTLLKPLKELLRIFHAHLYLLYVVGPSVKIEEEFITDVHVTRALEEIPYTVHTLAHTDVAAGINQFIEDKAINMVVTVPRKHTFFNSLFHESNTKKLAFHGHVPILALHE